MSSPTDKALQLPDSLSQQLLSFRRRVWRLKLLEALAAAVIGVLVGFLLTYALDRLIDTPAALRGLILAGSVACCAAVPYALDHWVFRRRRMDQLAKLLAETEPSAGDQLLGIIQLSADATEQSRSPELAAAAIRQVAEDVGRRDLNRAVPNPRHRQRGLAAIVLSTACLVLLVTTWSASTNAWSRFLAPWKETPRYTFAAVRPLPERLVVPHGEPFDMALELDPSSRWRPGQARLRLSDQSVASADLTDDTRYPFRLPGQIESVRADVRVGDFRATLPVEPVLRPELSSIRADVGLPDYLGRDDTISQAIRGAALSVVRGSETTLTAVASRPLTTATVNGESVQPEVDQFRSAATVVEESTTMELAWKDAYGLSGKQPFRLSIEAIDDQPPTLVCEELPRRGVLLDSEVLSFTVRSHDDFGVKLVGIEWQGLDETVRSVAKGERVIGAGNHQAEFLRLSATFCALDEKIQPQPIAVRVFVEDYLPERERVYSPTCVFNVLDAEQHSIWITSQLTRWHRMSLDVRDREMQLYESNKQLRDLPQDELELPDTRRQLARQAAQEKANGRRLSGLVRKGESLLREAMRNPEIGVGHLDQWAEMMQVLKDISGNRMPSVAQLLKDASQAQAGASAKSNKDQRQVGQNRLNQSGGGAPKEQDEKADEKATTMPSISDVESTQHEFNSEDDESKPKKSQPSNPRLTLPGTMLAGDAKSDSEPTGGADKVDQAVEEQKDLLAEFDKVAGELNEVLANLEGSTLVKRLKAASRKQQQVASRLATMATDAFGVSEPEKDADAGMFTELAEAEADSSQDASNIIDDMSAYFDRSRFMQFGRVLEEMREQDVTAGLRQLGQDLRRENGLSISQAEYWSDTFDRWAEDLVEVTKGGACPGSKAKGSLPPSIVLEVLKLLEGEVDLREKTRVAEQARPAVSETEHTETASQLSQTQNDFQQRMEAVVQRISELPDAEADFSKEMELLSQVSSVMMEATEILAKPETGPPAIAAETEIIELLLQSKRFNPNSSGGGGSQPGGGGDGTTEVAALALVGSGVNDKEVREELPSVQSTGTTGPSYPEEFRAGLDAYFSRFEEWKSN